MSLERKNTGGIVEMKTNLRNEELSKDRQLPPGTGTSVASFGLNGGRTPVASARHGIP
jgi:hypothetical protein